MPFLYQLGVALNLALGNTWITFGIVKIAGFLFICLAFLLVFSPLANADGAPLGNLTLNTSNTTAAAETATIDISFTVPQNIKYSNISINFPEGFFLPYTGDKATLVNLTTLPNFCETETAIVNNGTLLDRGQNVSTKIKFCADNFVANTTFYSWRVSNVRLPLLASTDWAIKVYMTYTDAGGGQNGPTTLTGFNTTANTITNVTIGVSEVYNSSRFVNLSGNVFNVTAFGQDTYGNTNITGGFNFEQNNTNVTYFSGLGGGNGTSYAIFNATFNGTSNLNVSAVRDLGKWNSTGVNLTTQANVVAGLNYTANATSIVAGGQVLLSVIGFDLNGNVNNSGGFNFHGNNSGQTLVSGNASVSGVFNLTANGTWSFNVSSGLNSSAWNSTGSNVTVSSGVLFGLNVSYNVTSLVAGGQLALTGTGFDRFGNLNFSGGFNFTSANSTAAGVTYVSGNESNTGVFNFTRNGTFAFNVSAFLNSSLWNVSLAQNATVASGVVVGLNVSYNATSLVAGSQLALTGTGFDRFGNLNFSGGFNFTSANSTAAGVTYVSGNESNTGVFNFTRNGTFAFNASSSLNGSAWNVSIAQNVTVSADYISGVNLTYNATSLVAGGQLLLTSTGFDRFGNMNNSGGFNFTLANSTASGVTYVSGNESISGVFNLTSNGTFAFNASSSLNGSAFNISTGQNITVTSNVLFGLNVSYNATSLVAGSQLALTGTGFDRFGNLNFSGGFNFTPANSTAAGITYVSGNESNTGVFNLTRNGTFAFNVSAFLNSTLWNVSLAQNATVTSANILFVNVTGFSGYPVYSNSTVSQSVNGTFNVTAFAVDRFGNLNFSGGFNFQGGNHSVVDYISGNGTLYGVFNTSLTGTAVLTVYSARDFTVSNGSATLNSTVHPVISSVAVSGITISEATITWDTLESADSLVEYSSNLSDSSFTAAHSVELSGLLIGTKYTYRVHSCSTFNLCSFSSYSSFTTNSPPVEVGGSPAPGSAQGAGATSAGGSPTSPVPFNETSPNQPALNATVPRESQSESGDLPVGQAAAGVAQGTVDFLEEVVLNVGETASGLLEKLPGVAPFVEQFTASLPRENRASYVAVLGFAIALAVIITLAYLGKRKFNFTGGKRKHGKNQGR